MIAVFCALIVLGLGHCEANDLPSRFEIESSINRTIEEVERMIREDPGLPRLTRHEIVDILYNITSKELDAYKDKDQIVKARELYQRALMVVLPYSAQDTSGNLKDFYTKPPMTQILPDGANFDRIETESRNNLKQELEGSTKARTRTTESVTPSTLENLVTRKTTSKDYESTTMKTRYKNHRETYSEVFTKLPLKETLKIGSAPLKFSFNLENLQKNYYTAEKVTKRPVYQKDRPYKDDKNNSKFEVVYDTTVTKKPTTKPESEEITIDLQDPKTTSPKSKPNQNILSSDQWRYNAPPSTTPKPITHFKYDKSRENIPFLPTTVKILPEDAVPLTATNNPETFTKISKLPTETATLVSSEVSTSLYVTPMPLDTSEKPKYSSSYSVNSGGFRRETTTAAAPMRVEVMDLLASIGLRPGDTRNVEDIYKKSNELLKKFEILNTNAAALRATSALSSVEPSSASIVSQNTFEGPGTEIKKGVENLSPDVQLLFQRFGLQSSNLGNPATTSTERSTTVLNSYTNFKPLPTSSVRDQEMKQFLARFGLGDTRQEKAMATPTKPPSVIEAVPGNMRPILENIGLITRKKPNTLSKKDDDMEATETTKYHVFKPHEVHVKDEGQRVKINELLDTVKMVQEGKANVQDVQKVANDLLRTTKTLKDGPDPLSLEEIIRIYNDDVRNEVKRQQNQQEAMNTTDENAQDDASTANMTETTSEETTSISTTTSAMTDSSKAASDLTDALATTSESSTPEASTASSNLMALEESFGGSTREPDPVLPAKKKSGLYFLVDWNTFLEVGEEQQKINLRFEPKVGDRTRFLPISVP